MFIAEDDRVYIEPEDQCNDCDFFGNPNPEKQCQLMEAFAYGFVTLVDQHNSTMVKNCKGFKKRERNLKVVKD